MPCYDYKCMSCDHVERSLFFKISELPKIRHCGACGKNSSTQIFDQRRGSLKPNHIPGRKRNFSFGDWHPQFGCVVESASHYKELCKKYGVRDADDNVGGANPWDEDRHRAWEDDNRETAEVSWGDDLTPQDHDQLVDETTKAHSGWQEDIV